MTRLTYLNCGSFHITMLGSLSSGRTAISYYSCTNGLIIHELSGAVTQED